MSMKPYNPDIAQVIKWFQNQAPNIQSLITQKKAWYSQFNDLFWSQWETNVFDLRTANNFGCYIWCIILGVPAQLFGFYQTARAWAFGSHRQNFKYSAATTLTHPNTLGGNFIGGGTTTLVNISEVRRALRMRYYAMICPGNIDFINKALLDVFGDLGTNNAWDFPNKKYFYVSDITCGDGTVTSPLQMKYHVGANLNISVSLINLFNNAAYGLLPVNAGVSYTVVRDS